MEKKSNLLAAPILHGAQNAITRQRYLKPRKEYLKSFMEGFTGKAHKTKTENFTEGFISGTISPEFGEINKRMTTLGKSLSSQPRLSSKRELVKLRQAARGEVNAKGAIDVRNIVGAMEPKVKRDISSIIGTNVDQIKSISGDRLSKVINDTKSLRVFESLFDKTPKALESTNLAKNKKYNRAGKLTGLTGTTAADPIAGAMNAKKLFLASDHAAKVPGLAKVQSKARELVISNPLKREFGKGIQGKKRSTFSKIRDEAVFSPALRDAKDFSNSLGNALS